MLVGKYSRRSALGPTRFAGPRFPMTAPGSRFPASSATSVRSKSPSKYTRILNRIERVYSLYPLRVRPALEEVPQGFCQGETFNYSAEPCSPIHSG